MSDHLSLGSTEVVATDLEYVVSRLESELEAMADTSVLLTGGAGFLGYYLTQALARWNTRSSTDGRASNR